MSRGCCADSWGFGSPSSSAAIPRQGEGGKPGRNESSPLSSGENGPSAWAVQRMPSSSDDKSGLLKWKSTIDGWVEGYFMLKGGCLYHFADEPSILGDRVPAEKPLKLFHSDPPRFFVPDNRLVFNISSDTVSYTLRAETAEVAQAWAEAFQSARSREQSGL